MSSELLHHFQPVWGWMRTNHKALDALEYNLFRQLEEQEDSGAQAELNQLRLCRQELENFAILSLWAIFEEALNQWLSQRTHWAGVIAAHDQEIRKGLLRRIQYWSIAEKIDALKPVFGKENTSNLHALRSWRDWVAHRKAGPRPEACDIEMAQSLLLAALTRLEMYPAGTAEALV